jgi:hypothetical protein
LHYGQITKLSAQTFATLPNLVNIGLEFNRITEIETGAFDGLINLRVLNLAGNNLEVFYFNVFERTANKLGSPVNLRYFCFDSSSIESVQWSSETNTLLDESTLNEREKKEPEDDPALLFAKCGFRNKLDVKLQYKRLPKCSFLEAIAAKGFVHLS